MREILVVIDMQNDFVTGALGTPEAVRIVPRVKRRIENFNDIIVYTRDTHDQNYAETLEGKNLPIPHCIRKTEGWKIVPSLPVNGLMVIDKPTFGSLELASRMRDSNSAKPIDRIILIGLCTDICVIANAMLLKAYLPNVEICVDASCCAGTTPQNHRTALEAMKMCQIVIENDELNHINE